MSSLQEDTATRARELLAGILERMGIEAEISVTQTEEQIRLDIECDDVQRIIGRRGQVVDALQHLTGKMLGRGSEGRGLPVVVDAGGYRARQVERLQSLAARMGEKARQSGGPVELSPMNAHDRRIIHLALVEMDGVTTQSEGEGDLRHVVVLPVDDADGSASAPAAE